MVGRPIEYFQQTPHEYDSKHFKPYSYTGTTYECLNYVARRLRYGITVSNVIIEDVPGMWFETPLKRITFLGKSPKQHTTQQQRRAIAKTIIEKMFNQEPKLW